MVGSGLIPCVKYCRLARNDTTSTLVFRLVFSDGFQGKEVPVTRPVLRRAGDQPTGQTTPVIVTVPAVNAGGAKICSTVQFPAVQTVFAAVNRPTVAQVRDLSFCDFVCIQSFRVAMVT
jgi:hypothetical protein